jgi:hypothetical protein
MLVLRKFFSTSTKPSTETIITVRCPICKQIGVFIPYVSHDLCAFEKLQPTEQNINLQFYLLGHRKCPNPECLAHIFFVYSGDNKKLLATYPPEVLDFDSSNIPTPIVATLEEALLCHANKCYRAAAMLVRRTLEELCEDRGAEGRDLRDRLNNLSSKVVLPSGLVQGLTEVRLLGNDAAHLKSREYDQVGKDEVEIAMKITKLVLQAIYQLDDIVAQLQALKSKTQSS